MHAFVAADELVGEAQAWHEAALLEPEDGAEAAGEEDAFHGRERHNALCEASVLNPLEGPVCFLLHAIEGFDCVEELILFCFVLAVGVDQQRVGFALEVLHHDVEAIEELGFGVLNLSNEVLGKVFVHDAI